MNQHLSPVDSVTGARARLGQWLHDQMTSYQILDILGYGTYGCIYLAKTAGSASEYRAIKCLSKRGLSSAQLLLQRQEIDIHLSLSSATNGQHQHIVDMLSVIEDSDSLYLVMEYCSGGDLYDAITSQHSDARDSGVHFSSTPSTGHSLNVHSDASVISAMIQITSALAHAHRRQVFHRDLKPENILLAGDGSLKLADFGLATKDRVSNDFGCGSSFYMAPEQQSPPRHPTLHRKHARRPYLPSKSDVWSLGIIFLNLRFGRNPWKLSRVDSDHTFASYAQNPLVLKEMFPELSMSALYFLQRVLCVDPNDRADSYEALEILHRMDTIVDDANTLCATMEECDNESARAMSASSYEPSSRAPSSSPTDSLQSRRRLPDESDSIFKMEDDYGASPVSSCPSSASPVSAAPESKQSGASWTRSSCASSWSSISSHQSGKSWSDMVEEEEMDFSLPVHFEEPAQEVEDSAHAHPSAFNNALSTSTTTNHTAINSSIKNNTYDLDNDQNNNNISSITTSSPFQSYDHYNTTHRPHVCDQDQTKAIQGTLQEQNSFAHSFDHVYSPSTVPTTSHEEFDLDNPGACYEDYEFSHCPDTFLDNYHFGLLGPMPPPTLVGQHLFCPFTNNSYEAAYLAHPP
ncbi:hypothetical protein BGZ94_002585 [Podila epigama]|nr:hypothetical protein BGZ94_002585 [Podila epigama]